MGDDIAVGFALGAIVGGPFKIGPNTFLHRGPRARRA